MDLLAPFTGVLYLPDKEFFGASSPVLLSTGEPVAGIRWHFWTQKFEVLDPKGVTVAECVPTGVFRRRYTVWMRDGRRVVDLHPGVWRAFDGADLVLASGRRLEVHQMSIWPDRKFEFSGPEGVVGRITPTTGVFSMRPDSYAFELFLPVMSALEAISLAQALRVAVDRRRQAASS